MTCRWAGARMAGNGRLTLATTVSFGGQCGREAQYVTPKALVQPRRASEGESCDCRTQSHRMELVARVARRHYFWFRYSYGGWTHRQRPLGGHPGRRCGRSRIWDLVRSCGRHIAMACLEAVYEPGGLVDSSNSCGRRPERGCHPRFRGSGPTTRARGDDGECRQRSANRRYCWDKSMACSKAACVACWLVGAGKYSGYGSLRAGTLGDRAPWYLGLGIFWVEQALWLYSFRSCAYHFPRWAGRSGSRSRYRNSAPLAVAPLIA